MNRLPFLSPPLFEDVEMTRISRLLSGTAVALIGAVLLCGLLGVVFVPENMGRWMAGSCALFFMALSTLGLLHQKQLRLASINFVLQFWLIVSFLVVTGGGIESPGMSGYIPTVLAAALFIGWRGGAVVAGLCFLTSFGLVLAQSQGILPPSAIHPTPVHTWVGHTLTLSIVMILVYYYAKSLRELLLKAQQELEQRITISDQNTDILEQLAERVKELTCLHDFGLVLWEEEEMSAVLTRLTTLLSASIQYPEQAQVRVRMADKEVQTPQFVPSPRSLRVDCVANDGQTGLIEVVYSDAALAFLPEEIALLETLAGMLRRDYEHRQAVDALSASESQLRALFAAMEDVVMVLDPQGRCLQIAPTQQTGLFHSPELMLGQHISEILPPETAVLMQTQIDRALETRAPVHIEYPIWTEETQVWFYGTLSPFNQDSVIWIARDVTARKKLEEQLRRTQRLESLGTLAGGIAHDLNNMLTPIMLSLDLLESKMTDPALKKLLLSLGQGTHRGAQVVKQILTFARGSHADFEVQQLQQHINEIKTFTEKTFPKNISLSLDIPDKPWFVRADSTQLHQVLLNLCLNARDAMPEGGKLTLGLTNIVLEEDLSILLGHVKAGKYVLLSVSDSGEGMTEAILEHLFEPFFTTKEFGKGTGLGLSMVQGIVREHKGFIDVNSVLGKGTTFKIYWPVDDAAIAEETPLPKLPVPAGQGEHILVVDDEKAVVNITQELLESYGYEVTTAQDGLMALNILTAKTPPNPIKLVLTDINMPKIGGLELIKLLRQNAPEVEIIACTGSLEQLQQHDVKAMHVSALLLKPYTTEQLLRVLNQALHSPSLA